MKQKVSIHKYVSPFSLSSGYSKFFIFFHFKKMPKQNAIQWGLFGNNIHCTDTMKQEYHTSRLRCI